MTEAAYYEGNRQIRLGAGAVLAPGPGEARLKISHCGICGTDLHIYHGAMDARVSMPLVMGHEMSATVDALGPGVTGFAPGEPVVVMPLAPCGDCPACAAGHSHICHNLDFLGIDTPGAFQSYWNVPAYTLHGLPPGMSLKHGALIEPLAVAVHDVRLADVQAGDQVVVLGGGPIGMLVALVARQRGADVIVSEINPYRVALARRLGMEAVNPNEQDLVELVMRRTKSAGADIVFEVSGSQAGAAIMTELLRTRGLAVIVAIFARKPEIDLFRFFWRELRLQGVRVYESQDFSAAIELAASAELPLDELITDIRPLSALQSGFEAMDSGGQVMKILLEL